MQEIYEKLGLFYLGKDVDKNTLDATEAHRSTHTFKK